jgi:hypothetical protein
MTQTNSPKGIKIQTPLRRTPQPIINTLRLIQRIARYGIEEIVFGINVIVFLFPLLGGIDLVEGG